MTEQPPSNMLAESTPQCNCGTGRGEESDSNNSKSNSTSRCCFKQKFWSMLHNKFFTDVCFIVGYEPEIQRIDAHKSVLWAGSAVFEAMFSRWSGDSNEIEIPDVEPPVFFSMLRFIYTDDVQITVDSVMKILYAAKKYEIIPLENRCSEFLKEQLNPENACSFLTQAKLFDQEELIKSCLEVIDDSPDAAFMSDGFTSIDLASLCSILERDSLKICEIALFEAVLRWSVAECQRQNLAVNADNQKSVLQDAKSLIRFPLMSLQEFASNVLPFDLLSKEEITGMVQYFGGVSKASCGFISNPRSLKEFLVADRFEECEWHRKWSYKANKFDGIGFSFDRDVSLAGFGIHNFRGGSGEKYKVDVIVKNQETGLTLYQSSTRHVEDSEYATFRVFLHRPVRLTAKTLYAVITQIQGPDSICGTKGVRAVSVKGPKGRGQVNVTFQSIDYEGSHERTDVDQGQIPEILFYL